MNTTGTSGYIRTILLVSFACVSLSFNSALWFGEPTCAFAADGAGQSATVLITVAIGPSAPIIDYFTATPETIAVGESSTLAWETTSADSVEINPDIGPQPVDGSLEVSPSITTTYTLTATGPGGTATDTVAVAVTDPSVYYVPDDYPTIQKALDGCTVGDTIVVRDGVYTGEGNRNIYFRTPSITLRSESGPQNCIIDLEHSAMGFCFYLRGPSDTVLDGFMIINAASPGQGGAIWCNDASPKIMNCFIINNRAVYAGGGIWCWNSSPTISNCIITGNWAGASGGGIECRQGSSPILTDCIISDNSAVHRGGGIACSGASLTVINSTFSGNSVELEGGGGAIYHRSSPLSSITNCTFNKNSAASGGGIHCEDGSTTVLTNCILWGDTAQNGPEISLTGGSSLTVSHSNIEGGETVVYREIDCTLGWLGGNMGQLSEHDPVFVAAGYRDESIWVDGDYHLMYDSPCIDAGTDAGAPQRDIDGEARPEGAGYDMGWDEWVDSDNDGMSDRWELDNALDPLVDDADSDHDGDGYRNIIEYLARSDPNDVNSLPHYVRAYPLEVTSGTDYSMIVLSLEETGYLTASDLCAAIQGCEVVVSWDTERQGYDDYVNGFPFTDYPLVLGKGYLVGVTVSSTFVERGIIPNDLVFNLTTSPGTDYNVISLPYGMLDIRMASDLCNSIFGCEVVRKWVVDRQGYDDYISGLPFTDFRVEPGMAYFVGVTVDSTWP